jgi:hypothetical protein
MLRPILYISMAIVAALLTGCQQPPEEKYQIPFKGIKLADLRPPEQKNVQPSIYLKLLTYEMPEKDYAETKKAFDLLPTADIAFASKLAFTNNGFVVGTAQSNLWPMINSILQNANARRTFDTTMIITDNFAEDFKVTAVTAPRIASYLDLKNDFVQTTLHFGHIVWSLNANPIPFQREAIRVNVNAAFKQNTNSISARLAKKSNDKIFNAAEMTITMDPGDFAVIGTDLEKKLATPDNQISLRDFFFRTRADFMINNPVELNGPDPKKSYTLLKDIPIARIYIIFYAGMSK